jgi:hypothetical protein
MKKLPLIILVLVGILCACLFAVAIRQGNSAEVSAIAAFLSAIVALVISVRGQQMTESHRKADRQEDVEARKEALNQATKERIERKAEIATIFATEIEAWFGRKDIRDLTIGISKAAGDVGFRKINIDFQKGLREKGYLNSHPETNELANSANKDWERLLAELKDTLRLPSARAFGAIPNIWAGESRRADLELLGTDAVAFSIAMGVAWTNLLHMANDIPPGEDCIVFIEGNLRADVKQYLDLLDGFLNEFENIIIDFIKSAKSFTNTLRNGGQIQISTALNLVERSQKSLQIKNLEDNIYWREANERARAGLERFKKQLEDARASNAASEEEFKKFRKSAEEFHKKLVDEEQHRKIDPELGDQASPEETS